MKNEKLTQAEIDEMLKNDEKCNRIEHFIREFVLGLANNNYITKETKIRIDIDFDMANIILLNNDGTFETITTDLSNDEYLELFYYDEK